jgi:hypothetical protein
MLGNRHLATFLLGAIAGVAAYKYVSMSDEEKEKLVNDIKAKANKIMDQAGNADKEIAEYFNELKAKGSDVLKEHWPKVEEFFNDLFKGAKTNTANTAETAAQA